MLDIISKYKFKYYDTIFDKELILPVVYSEDFLTNELLDINLARLCCSLCCTSFDEQALRLAFQNCGFENIKSYYGGDDSLGAAVCTAQRGKNVFAVIRGSMGREWYSNFDIGTAYTHQGYAEATRRIMPLFDRFAKENCRLLFTGHSRGGALANLIASRLLLKGRDEVYAYTFACPNVTTDDEVYNRRYRNIYNFAFEDDFITHCPPPEWGYGRYGNTVNFKNSEINFTRFRSAFKELTGREFVSFREHEESVTHFTDTINKLASNPEEYYLKKYLVDGEEMSLYDYFHTICDLFTQTDPADAGFRLLSTKLSEFAPLGDFLASGIDLLTLIEQGGIQNSCAMYAHSCLSYLCLLNTQKIKTV